MLFGYPKIVLWFFFCCDTKIWGGTWYKMKNCMNSGQQTDETEPYTNQYNLQNSNGLITTMGCSLDDQWSVRAPSPPQPLRVRNTVTKQLVSIETKNMSFITSHTNDHWNEMKNVH